MSGWAGFRREPQPLPLRVLSSSWTLGVIAALVSWRLRFTVPFGGLDSSWWAGLYMATHRGLDFGTQIVFPFGPLGFLRHPWLWFGDLAALSFVYLSVLHAALAVSLVWALRRTLNPAASFLLACLILIVAASIDVAVALTAVWCLVALSPEPPRFASRLVVFGGAALGAIETLTLLRSGPLILAMCAIAILGQRNWRRELPTFVACSVLGVLAAWLAAGQSLGTLPDFIRTAPENLSGYSEVMGTPASSGLYLPVIVAVGVALVVGAAIGASPGRQRVAAAAVIGLASFLLYKEAVVRAEPGHRSIFFATAVALGAGIAFRRQRVVAVSSVAVLACLAVAFPFTPHSRPDFNPLTHLRLARDQMRILVSGKRREDTTAYARAFMTSVYGLPRSTLALLRGHTVHVDPWETGVVWAYRLDWAPLPVYQDVTAYTSELDRLNSDALRSPTGPDRILQENTTLVAPEYPRAAIDGRWPAWDPPAQSIAMLCNYVPLQTTPRWQVLGKVPDRCGEPEPIGSTRTRYGEAVSVPAAESGSIVFAKIYGAGVSGLERLRTTAYRAAPRYVVVNGAAIYRLVPGTATDGLIMNSGPRADYPGPYALSPGARTIALEGKSGTLRVDLYAMRVGR